MIEPEPSVEASLSVEEKGDGSSVAVRPGPNGINCHSRCIRARDKSKAPTRLPYSSTFRTPAEARLAHARNSDECAHNDDSPEVAVDRGEPS